MEREKRTMALEVRQLKAQLDNITKNKLANYAGSEAQRDKPIPISLRKLNNNHNSNKSAG